MFRVEFSEVHRRLREDMRLLQGIPEVERVALTRSVLKAASRVILRRDTFWAHWELGPAGFVLIAPLTFQILTSPQPGTYASEVLLAGTGITGVISLLLLARVFGKLASYGISRWPQLFIHFLRRASAFVLPLALLTLGYLSATHPAPASYSRRTLSWPIALDVFTIAIATLATAAWLFTRRMLRHYRHQSLDVMMMGLLAIAARIGHVRRAGQWNDAQARSLAVRLEALAWTAEYYPPFEHRAPLTDYRARALARKEGARLAALIRLHKEPVLTALRADQLERVEASICHGLLCWSRGDWTALTEHAPAVVSPRRWYRVWQRVWPAGVLAGFALLLPMIHQLAGSQVAASIRISLLVAAALSLVTGGVPVADKVQDVVGKSLPWLKSG